MQNDLVSLATLSRRLKLPRGWLKDQADSGKIPCLKIGSRYLFSLVAAQEALAARAARGGEEGASDA